MQTSVVNIHGGKSIYDQYIGRPGQGQDGYFGNPHSVHVKDKPWTTCKVCKQAHTREEAVIAYQKDFNARVSTDLAFKQRVENLRGKTLGCFCRPKNGFQGKLMCHGQVIAGFLDGKRPEDVD